MRLIEITLAHSSLYCVQIFHADVFFPTEGHFLECPVCIHGNAAMEQQVRVENGIHAPLMIQHAHMLLQLFAVHKGGFHLIHNLLFFFRQLIGVFRVNRREIHIIHGIFHAIHKHGSFFKINLIQQQSVFHAEFGAAFDNLPLHLPLHDGNCLVHFGNHVEVLITQHLIPLGLELLTGVAGVFVHRKGCQRQKVNAVILLYRIQICISGLDTQHITNQGLTACRRAHPCDIVVAPLDIHRMIMRQNIHDSCGMRTPVINIPDNMQLVNRKPLNQITHPRSIMVCILSV